MPRIAITVGDPAGIGPEIAVKAAADSQVRAACEPVLYGPTTEGALRPYAKGVCAPEAGLSAYESIVRAVEDARAGRAAGIATGPISKEAFARAGVPWTGHTELLAHLTKTPRVAMMFYSDALRVIDRDVLVPLSFW